MTISFSKWSEILGPMAKAAADKEMARLELSQYAAEKAKMVADYEEAFRGPYDWIDPWKGRR